MKFAKFLVCTTAIALTTSAFAQDREAAQEQAQQQANAQAEKVAEDDDEDSRLQEVTCRTEPVLGSRTRVNRVCMTRAEWNRLSQDTRRGQDRMMRNANRNQACSFGGGC